MKQSIDRRYPNRPFMHWERKRQLAPTLRMPVIRSQSKVDKARKIAIANEVINGSTSSS